MLPQAGPTLCPARLTASLYVVDSAGGTNHYEPSLSLSVPPGHLLALEPHLSMPLCGQLDPDKKQEAKRALVRPLGRRAILHRSPSI